MASKAEQYRASLQKMQDCMKALKKGELQRAYLFHGGEEYLKSRAEGMLRRACVTPGMELMDLALVNGESCTGEGLLRQLETPAMASPRRLVLVKDDPRFALGGREDGSAAQELKAFPKALESRLGEGVCLLWMTHGEIPATKVWYKALAKEVCAVNFPLLETADALPWLSAMARERQLNLPAPVARLLFEYTGGKLANCDGELEKLSAYCGENPVTEEAVRALCVQAVEYKIFDMIGDLQAGRADRALRAYHRLVAEGESPARVLILIGGQLRAAAFAPMAQRAGLDSVATARALGAQGFVVERILRQRQGDPAFFQAALKACADADAAFKTGQMSEEAAVENFLLRFAAGR